MIVTLAGHVDHGKTTLVRLLTGIDTDRLAEERRRGLTIDLGFAYLEADGATLGFVDVPGHHRFIHNMVAGVAAHQFALLVVAADDGPMPQTLEHLQILSLIGVRRGLVALTKSDRVEPARRAAAAAEVRALLTGSFLADCPIIPTAATSGAGVADLRTALIAAAAGPAAPSVPRPFRLAIDRAFSLKGAGLVVTGTVHDGRIAVDDTVRHFPSGASARVRSLRVQNRPAGAAGPGDRAALNLSGLGAIEPVRGDWLSARAPTGHRQLVIEVDLLPDLNRTLRPWLPVHVYHATTHSTGRLALFDAERVAAALTSRQGTALHPATRRWAELDCDQPLPARHGDRVVLRDQGQDRTIGGGRVIDNRARPRRRHSAARLASLAALQQDDAAAALRALLALGAVQLDDFAALWDLDDPDLARLCAAEPASRHGPFLIHDRAWADWRNQLQTECERRHAADPTLQGLQENAFVAPVPAAFRGELLRDLAAGGTLDQRAGRYRPARHQVALAPAEAALLARLDPLLAPPQPLSLGDIGKQLKIPLPTLQRAIRPLVAKGALVQINDKRVYLPSAVLALAEAATHLATRGPFTAAAFRDAAGIGRNLAIDILEFFDARGFTRRTGDVRTVAGDSSWLLRA